MNVFGMSVASSDSLLISLRSMLPKDTIISEELELNVCVPMGRVPGVREWETVSLNPSSGSANRRIVLTSILVESTVSENVRLSNPSSRSNENESSEGLVVSLI